MIRSFIHLFGCCLHQSLYKVALGKLRRAKWERTFQVPQALWVALLLELLGEGGVCVFVPRNPGLN